MIGVLDPVLLIMRTAVYFLLLIIPGLAGCVGVVKRGERDAIIIGLVGLISIGITGFLAFWFWFLSPLLGQAFSILVPVVAALYSYWGCRQLDASARKSLQELTTPILLVFAFTTFVLSLGFLYGGSRDPLVTARPRFSHELPADNELPLMFANELRAGHVMKPMFIDWLSSDRPPLQTGIVLSEFPLWAHPATLQYMVVSVILQGLSIFSLWLFLRAFHLDSRAIALAMTAAMFSGFFILNSFFVWPKLLAAAYMLPCAGLFLSDCYRAIMVQKKSLAVLAGVLLALSMLAHGGTAFALLGLILTLVVLRIRVKPATALLVLLSASAFYAPWMLYQKFYDPPGNRLLKMHLAGVDNIDPRPFGKTLVSAYRDTGWQGALANKEANAITVFDNQREYWTTAGHFFVALLHNRNRAESLDHRLLVLQFFYFFPTLGFLMIGPLFLIGGIYHRGRSRGWRISARLWCYVFCTLLGWICLMFRPGSTVIHQGTYAAMLLAFVGSVLAMWAVSRRIVVTVLSIQVCFTLLVYGVYCTAHGVLNIVGLLVTVFAFVFVCLLTWQLAREQAVPGVAPASVTSVS